MRSIPWSCSIGGRQALVVLSFSWLSSCSSRDESAAPVALDYGALRTSFTSGRVPSDWKVPDYYRDPRRFLVASERTAQSVLGPVWQSLSKEQKLELLLQVKIQESLELLGPLADISWYSSPHESDFEVARSMLDALFLSSGNILEVALIVCEHMAQVTPNASVRAHAQRYVAALTERRRRLGR